MKQARKDYPYYGGYDDMLDQLEMQVAGQQGNWDRHLELAAQCFMKHPNSSHLAATYAGALAQKWVVTGDATFKRQSEEMMGKAQSLATTDEQREQMGRYSILLKGQLAARQLPAKAIQRASK